MAPARKAPIAAPLSPEVSTHEAPADEVDAAYAEAIEALAAATVKISKAGDLHRTAKLTIRGSMREGGTLTFAEHMPDDIGRRAQRDPEVSAVISAFRYANVNW